MMRAGIAKLITVSPEACGVGIDPEETMRTVHCTTKSIGMQEAYQAMATGLNPEIKICLAHDFEYQDETLLEYDGKIYKIIRTYITEADGIELTCQRVTGNARSAIDAEAVAIQERLKAEEKARQAELEEIDELIADIGMSRAQLIEELKRLNGGGS